MYLIKDIHVKWRHYFDSPDKKMMWSVEAAALRLNNIVQIVAFRSIIMLVRGLLD